MDNELLDLILAIIPNIALILSLTVLYSFKKLNNTEVGKELTSGQIGFWISLFIEGAERMFGRYTGDEKKEHVKELARAIGMDFTDEEFDLAIDSTVEKLTAEGVINNHEKK